MRPDAQTASGLADELDARPPESSEARFAPDLPSRIRRAIAHQDRAELDLLQPLIRALAYREVSLGEVKALDAEQALWLVAEREKEDGQTARARL